MFRTQLVKEFFNVIYDYARFSIVLVLALLLALNDLNDFHNFNQALYISFFFGSFLSVIMIVMDLFVRQKRYHLVPYPIILLFGIVFYLRYLSSAQKEEALSYDVMFNIPIFVITLPDNICRNEYIAKHLSTHRLKGHFINGFDVHKTYAPELLGSYLKYPTDVKITTTTNTLMTASVIRSMNESFRLSWHSDKWVIVLENDAKLDNRFTWKLPKALAELEDYDIVWLYKGINLGYKLTGNIPCCSVGMVYRRRQLPVILSKYNYWYLHEAGLITPTAPESNDLLLKSLCNNGHLRCTVVPLVSEAVIGKISTH
jgi:hypothetical protein